MFTQVLGKIEERELNSSSEGYKAEIRIRSDGSVVTDVLCTKGYAQIVGIALKRFSFEHSLMPTICHVCQESSEFVSAPGIDMIVCPKCMSVLKKSSVKGTDNERLLRAAHLMYWAMRETDSLPEVVSNKYFTV